MPAFRRLCPEQLLRPGDEVEISRVAIIFTDLQGSTKLYDKLGDAAAYRLVRDHFAYLSERVARHHGFIVKTVGDAVMAAFHDPADAVRAVLAMQDEVDSFNRGREDAGIVLKLGLHAGACIAVTAGELLDYFGSTVNTASRLEHQCGGGEAIISHAALPTRRRAKRSRAGTSSKTVRACGAWPKPAQFVRLSATTEETASFEIASLITRYGLPPALAMRRRTTAGYQRVNQIATANAITEAAISTHSGIAST